MKISVFPFTQKIYYSLMDAESAPPNRRSSQYGTLYTIPPP